MGIGGISIWQLLIILAIIVVLFGTKKLRNIGGDLGGAVKGFKKAMSDEDKANQQPQENTTEQLEQSDQESATTQTSSEKDKV